MRCTKKYIGLLVAAALVFQAVLPVAETSAAAKPKLAKKSVEVKVGAKKKVKVKNAKGYKLKVKSKKKAVVTAKKKGKAAFVVKGVKAGKAKVVATLKKGSKKVTLKCTVKVIKSDNVTPDNTVGPNPTQGTNVTPIPTATVEPTVAPFPVLDTYADVLPYGYDVDKSFVTKGDVEEMTYKSTATGKDVKVLVQLPAEYSKDVTYPVLYLIHDEEDTEKAWKDMAADQIIYNSTAFKMAKDMIVVMPNVNGAKDEDVISDFSKDLKPAIEAKYSVAKDRHTTAVAGYGTGGRIALCIGLTMEDQVAYTGALAPVEGALSYVDKASFGVPSEYSDKSFVMIQKGKSDNVAGNAPADYKNALSANGTDCLYLEMEGSHDTALYKDGLYNLIRRLFKKGTDDEGVSNGFVTKVPDDVDRAQPNQRGRIEVITYDTETYDEGNSVKMQKWANVFLPYDYDPDKKYNVLYLMHGGGENADTWIKGDNIYGDYTQNQKMVNWLFQSGYCDSCIIVNPTFYRPDGIANPENIRDLTVIFQHELRNDLIPAVEAKYSTYANGDVSIESLQASRMHRGFAGLSMGSNTTYESAFFANYDLFAWFAPYSGIFRDEDQYVAERDRFIKTIVDGEANGMPLGFFYCGNGTDDFALTAQYAIMEMALAESDALVQGRNFEFVMVPGGEHNMWQWHIHLYNTLKIFFTKE